MKMNTITYILVILLVYTFSCDQSKESVIFKTSQDFPTELRQLHRNVLAGILEESADIQEVQMLLAEMLSNGSWANIDYSSKERGAWQPRQHLSNLLAIAKAYQTIDNKFYQKKEVSTKIHLGLNYWLENDFQCPNWCYPIIGVPMVLNPIMILMEGELSSEQLEKGLVILNRCEIGRTGQNKVWQSGNVLHSSLLTRDIEMVKKASASIQEELVVSLNEGVQPDWSYHQHGPQLQFGNYGLSYVNDMIKWISILRKTPNAFDENKVSILRDYLLKGQRWVTWKDQFDISACGRQLFVDSPESKAASLSKSFGKMELLDPSYKDQYIKANDYTTLIGNKHFWRSDIQVQRTSNYYFSVKMCSERVIGAESCNSENLQGYYMGDGASFLYQSGEEYRNIFPFLDWKKIPGTTTLQDTEPLPVLTASGYRIPSDFVGGVSNSSTGIAVLDYDRNGLTARKSWFMLDDMIFHLGTGITSDQKLQVTTGINQSFLKGDVIIKTDAEEVIDQGMKSISNPLWILHDNIGYVFLGSNEVKLEAQTSEGSWNWVASRYPDERIQDEIFKLWFDHGENPKKQSYAYILVPNADKSQMSELENENLYEIKNDSDIQEIVKKDGTKAGVVFYMPAKSNALGGIEVNQPCVVLMNKQIDNLEISVSDPTQKLIEIELIIDGNYSHQSARIEKGKTIISISLPNGAEAGKTTMLNLKTI
jgi:chondroitin AC lyase